MPLAQLGGVSQQDILRQLLEVLEMYLRANQGRT
jgi:hypothetical protein